MQSSLPRGDTTARRMRHAPSPWGADSVVVRNRNHGSGVHHSSKFAAAVSGAERVEGVTPTSKALKSRTAERISAGDFARRLLDADTVGLHRRQHHSRIDAHRRSSKLRRTLRRASVRGELSLFNHVLVNTGVSGNRSSDVRAGFAHRIEVFEPSVVLIMLGTNDALDGEEGLERFRDDLFGHDLPDASDRCSADPADAATDRRRECAPPERDWFSTSRSCGTLPPRRAWVFVDHYAQWTGPFSRWSTAGSPG